LANFSLQGLKFSGYFFKILKNFDQQFNQAARNAAEVEGSSIRNEEKVRSEVKIEKYE